MSTLLIRRSRVALCSNYRAGFTASSIRSLSSSDGSNNEPRVIVNTDSQGIAQVQLNRPKQLNALDMKMFETISQTIKDLKNDRSIRAVVVSGNGKSFSSGLDVTKISKESANPFTTFDRLLKREDGEISNLAQHVAYGWRQLPVPVVCVVHGHCYGGGLQIALGADIRLATPDSKLSIMEAKWGMIPDMSATVTLRELVRIDVAKELTFTGRVISGTEAAEYGLVTRCVEDPHAEAMKVCKEIVEKSPDAVALAKELYQKTWADCSQKDALVEETELQRKLLVSWNQMAATGRNFGIKAPYFSRSADAKE